MRKDGFGESRHLNTSACCSQASDATMSLWYATQLRDFRLLRSSSFRHRELITRKGLYVRHSGQKTVNQIWIHSASTFLKVLNR